LDYSRATKAGAIKARQEGKKMKRIAILIMISLFVFQITAYGDEYLDTYHVPVSESGAFSCQNGIQVICTKNLNDLFSSLVDGATAFVWHNNEFAIVTFSDQEYLYVKTIYDSIDLKIDISQIDNQHTQFLIIYDAQ
jgi:hypothetical protein